MEVNLILIYTEIFLELNLSSLISSLQVLFFCLLVCLKLYQQFIIRENSCQKLQSHGGILIVKKHSCLENSEFVAVVFMVLA